MTVISHFLRVVYLAVPKNACTSVKSMMFEAESGRSVTELRDAKGNPANIHQIYPTHPTRGRIPGGLQDYTVVAVLRDPLSRFVSGYRHRVHDKRDIERLAAHNPERREAMAAKGLPLRPDAEFFAEHLEAYMAIVPMIRYHFQPQTDFVGVSAERIGLPVGPDGLDRIAALLSERAGRPVGVPHLMRSVSTEPVELSAAMRQKLTRFYEEDYTLLRRLAPGLLRAG